jgi:hypothetical protein
MDEVKTTRGKGISFSGEGEGKKTAQVPSTRAGKSVLEDVTSRMP